MVSRRHDSLGSRWRWRLFASLCSVSLGLGLGFRRAWARGWCCRTPHWKWPCCSWRFALIERHAGDWERVSVCGDRVIVEREQAGVRMRQEFNRYWARVEVEAGGLQSSAAAQAAIRRARGALRRRVARGHSATASRATCIARSACASRQSAGALDHRNVRGKHGPQASDGKGNGGRGGVRGGSGAERWRRRRRSTTCSRR